MRRMTAALLTLAWLAMAPEVQAGPPASVPVLLVHGIDDTGAIFEKLVPRLRAAGRSPIYTIDLLPNNGDVSLTELAVQVRRRVEGIRQETHAEKIDMVAFSLGGMVSRYYLQKLGGVKQVRRFVTVSSPHAGTVSAYFRWNPGASELRPGSPFIKELADSVDQLSAIDMTSIWSPFDMMIVPSWSSRLPGVKERVVPVLAHAWMLRDDRCCQAIIESLGQ